MQADDQQPDSPWWTPVDVPTGKTACWVLGPLRLHAWRGPEEWRVAWQTGDDPLSKDLSMRVSDDPPPDHDDMLIHRYVSATADDRLHATPMLADRAIVVQPATPLFLPGGQSTTLYVSTVIWVRLSAGADASLKLLETPALRPSDTWFGASTRWGELCYASKTLARTSSDSIDDYAHRAITPIVIENNGVDLLPVEQLRLPAPNLSVYASAGGRLWTDTVIFDRKHDISDAVLRISRRTAGDEECERLSEPRLPLQPNAVVRAFSRLFR